MRELPEPRGSWEDLPRKDVLVTGRFFIRCMMTLGFAN
uniref:DPOD2 n=1 Tax=Arundo donax TaxID=35708 RepID=A0A0A9F9R0_ARUDO